MNKSKLVKLLFAAITASAFIVLLGLGQWQLDRLEEKELLVLTVKNRIAAQTINLDEAEKIWSEKQDVNFYPVSFSGRIEQGNEQYYLSTYKGMAGWHLYSSARLENGKNLIINRGFIPYDLKTKPEGMVKTNETFEYLSGLSRNPLFKKPGSLLPDNDPESLIWYWKDFESIRSALKLDPKNTYSFFVDLAASEKNKFYPKGGVTRIEFPNSHLSYAFTWFGLAAALLIISFIYALGLIRNRQEE